MDFIRKMELQINRDDLYIMLKKVAFGFSRRDERY